MGKKGKIYYTIKNIKIKNDYYKKEKPFTCSERKKLKKLLLYEMSNRYRKIVI